MTLKIKIKMKKSIPLFFLFMLIFGFGFSQNLSYNFNGNKKINQYVIENWTTKNGLPTNSLIDICQTSDGYIWISSYKGLLRFNGIEFKVFDTENTPEFKTNGIGALEESSDSTLWITTQSSGLISYKNGKFKTHKAQEVKQLYSVIHIDEKDRIWVASPKVGWFVFENNKYTKLKYSKPLKNIELTSISRDSKGTLWFGTLQNGVMKYENNKFTTYKKSDGLLSNWVNYVFVDKNDLLWIGTDIGLVTYDGSNFKRLPDFDHNSVSHISIDKDDNMWFGMLRGLALKRHNSNKYEFINNKSGLNYNYITVTMIDNENSLWLINYRGGLSRIKDSKFTSYSQANGLHGKITNTVCEIDNGVILLGFNNGKISKIENDVISEFKTKSKLEGKRVRHIFKDSKDNIWISTYSGLLKINKDNSENWYNDKNGFPSKFIRLVFEDSKNNIWVGTRDYGVVKINENNTYTSINKKKGLNVNLVLSINEDKKGNLLVGTAKGGLSVIKDDKVVKNYTQKNGLISDVIFNTYIDEQNRIWVNASGGLNCITENKVSSFLKNKKVLPATTYDMLEDKNGNCWFPCSNGVIMIAKKELLKQIKKDTITNLKYKLFDKYDGLLNAECNATSKSMLSSNGKIWFPALNGIAMVEPDKLPENMYSPPVFVEKFLLNDSLLSLTDRIEIQQDKKRYTFDFSALSFYEPNEVFFKHKLEGYENKWSEPSLKRTISYTNLPPGKYSFKVIACNNDGLWNKEGNELKFTVEPHFYQTVWFYAIILIFVAGIFFIFYHIRIIHLKRKQKRLEELIQERTSEVVEKNEELKQQKEEIQIQAEELEKLSIVASETNNAVLIFDEKLNLIWVNEGYTKIYGYNVQEKIKNSSFNLIKKSTNPKIKKYIDQVISQKVSVTYESENQVENAKSIWVQTSLTPIFENDKLTKLIAIESDITEIQKAKDKISKQNSQITASIDYAQTIQKASLPIKEEMQKKLDYFLIFKPKDIVSGDFYWMSNLPENEGTIIAEIDCTGHGVPGAFMSLIGNTLLNEIVNYNNITSPALILTELDKLVVKALKQDRTNNLDGMDISVCLLKNEENKTLINFAGAKQNLIHYKNATREIIKIKGDRVNIGGGRKSKANKQFSNKEFYAEKNDMIYLMSDGFVDQNNNQRKRYGTPRLVNKLKEIGANNIPAQKNILESELNNWQGDEEQRDDITFIGIKIN